MIPQQDGKTVHELKVWPELLGAIEDGRKPFEVRKNDRDFKVGDLLWLREYDPAKILMPGNVTGSWCYSGRQLHKQVTYILPGGQLGIEAGYVILGLTAAAEIQFIPLQRLYLYNEQYYRFLQEARHKNPVTRTWDYVVLYRDKTGQKYTRDADEFYDKFVPVTSDQAHADLLAFDYLNLLL